MKKINCFIAGVTLALWFIHIFNPDSLVKILLGIGIGWTTVTLMLVLNEKE